jgi:hypothetical protein
MPIQVRQYLPVSYANIDHLFSDKLESIETVQIFSLADAVVDDSISTMIYHFRRRLGTAAFGVVVNCHDKKH